MKRVLFLVLASILAASVQGQRITFPITFDYSIGTDVFYDQSGFCDCKKVVQRKEDQGFTWMRESVTDCRYLDEKKNMIVLDRVWVESELPVTEWNQIGRATRIGGVVGLDPLGKAFRRVDTFFVFLTYRDDDRKLIVSSPGECECMVEASPGYNEKLKAGFYLNFRNCSWTDYERGELSQEARILEAENFPVAGWVENY